MSLTNTYSSKYDAKPGSRELRKRRRTRAVRVSRTDALVALQDTLRKPRKYWQAIGEVGVESRVVERDRRAITSRELKRAALIGVVVPDGAQTLRLASGQNTGIAHRPSAAHAAKLRDNSVTGRPGTIRD